jgi:chemotaxis protein MotB
MLIKKMCFHKQPCRAGQAGRLLRLVGLVMMAGVVAGCVSSSTFEEVSKERDELRKKQNALEGNTRLLRNKVESTEEQTARLKAELEGVQMKLSETNKLLDRKNKHLIEAGRLLDEKNARLGAASKELMQREAELVERKAELKKTESQLAESNKKLKATAEYMEKTNKLYDDLVSELSSELKANQIKISEMKDGVTVNLSQDILFPSGSATLNDPGIDVIKKVSGKLKNIPHQIIVAGFTDNVAIKGELAKKFPSNWELAGARAASVVRLLESQGVDSDKMTAVSFGENKPVASNDDWKLRAQNRRIEIRLRPVE